MSTRLSYILTALSGILGVAALISSFVILPPPPGATAPIAQLAEYARQNHNGMLFAAWLEGTGTLLNGVFVLAIVHLAQAWRGFASWITMLAVGAVLAVSLMYDTSFIGAVQTVDIGQLASGATFFYMYVALEHVFLIAPAIFLPLGFVVLGSRPRVLPGMYGYLAIVLGVAAEVMGLVGLFTATANNGGVGGIVINVVLIAQELWIVAAAIAFILSARKASDRPSVKEQESVVVSQK